MLLFHKYRILKPGIPLIGILAFLCMSSLNLSCKKIVDVQPTNISAEPLTWNNVSDTKAALMGIYTLFRSALANDDAQWLYGDLRYGDFSVYNRNDLQAIVTNNLNASLPVVQQLSDWRPFYAIVNSAAVFIEHAPQVVQKDPRYSAANLDLDIAQARALRALAYFYMVRIWGDVPLVSQAYDNGSFPSIPRSPAQSVLDYAERELLAAAQTLPYAYGVAPQSYYGQSQAFWNGVLLNKISAYAILAHIAAWEGNYSNVDAYAGFVMNNYSTAGITASNIATLTADNGLFSQSAKTPSQIVAFGASDVNGESSGPGHIEDLTLAAPLITKQYPDIYVSRDSIDKIFTDTTDVRFGTDTAAKALYTNYFINYNTSIPIFSKIKVIRDGVTTGTYPIYGSVILFTRLEDIILLRAEAMAALNERTNAILYLNMIKSNRGIPLFQATSTQNITDAVFEERRRELMGEGWRWYDLVRYNKLRQNNPAFTELIAKGGIYWPVSNEVLNGNSLIKQNSYWK